MILKYVKIEEDWDDLKNGSSVVFDLPTSKIHYWIHNSLSTEHWWLINGNRNDKIFDVLKINGYSFVESIVGYPCNGEFPEVKSLYDLKKVIKALDDECIKKFDTSDSKSKSESKFKIGDKVRILPRKGSSGDYRANYVNEMLDYVGKTTTIIDYKLSNAGACKWPDDGYIYTLKGFAWAWNSSMLELVEDSDSKEEKYIHPSQLKDGDIIKIWLEPDYNFIYIFKKYEDNCIHRYAGIYLKDCSFSTNPNLHFGYSAESTKITYATEDEKKLLREILSANGYYWNADNHLLMTKPKKYDVAIHPISPIISKYKTFVDPAIYKSHPNSKQEDSDELNLFPTKKHYQLNFNY